MSLLQREQLHGYQEKANTHIIENTHCALFLEMGLGKTVSSLTAIDWLMYQDLEVNSVLVIGPKRVIESVWEAEIQKWAHLKHLTTSKIVGTAKQRKEALRKRADIYLIGRDNVTWLCSQYGGSMLPFDMLVIDELSSFKNPKSLRFKALRKVQPSFKRVVGLTGTPAPNGLVDLWAQIYLLDRGERLGKFIGRYREDFFKPGLSNGHVVYKYNLLKGAEELIHERISDICMSMKAEDYLDLPGKIINDIFIDFPEALQQKYDNFKDEAVLELIERLEEEQGDLLDGEPVISAVNAAGLTNKLLQFANGAVYDESKNFHVMHDLKIDALKEILEDANGKPVLVAWTYRSDLERLLKALKKYKPVQLKDDADVVNWNEGKYQVMLMHPASGGHGLNLQSGGHIIVWFGQTWSLELYQQFNARLDRQGQTDKVIINRLIARNTIDQKVVKAIEGKDIKQNGLMEAVKVIVKDVKRKYYAGKKRAR